MSKLERLLKLLAVLLDTTVPLTADDLRQRIGGYPDNTASFRRAFERDKDDLRKLGVVISVERVADTGTAVRVAEAGAMIDAYIVHREDYAGQDPGLEPDELAALHLAAAMVRVDNLSDEAFWKLGGGDRADAEQVGGSMPAADVAGQFHTAITERRTTTFTYHEVKRVLEPSRISFVQGNWYVSGFDQTRGATRVFRIDRIQDAIALGQPNSYERQPARGPETIRTWELGDEASIEATVQIDAAAALWATLHLRDDEIERSADGSVRVTLQVRNRGNFRDWVLSFLDAAVILSPDELRSDMVNWLDDVAKAHA